MEAFEAHAPAADLDDLRGRLAAARLPEAETVPRTAVGRGRWEQGVPLAGFGYSDKPVTTGRSPRTASSMTSPSTG